MVVEAVAVFAGLVGAAASGLAARDRPRRTRDEGAGCTTAQPVFTLTRHCEGDGWVTTACLLALDGVDEVDATVIELVPVVDCDGAPVVNGVFDEAGAVARFDRVSECAVPLRLGPMRADQPRRIDVELACRESGGHVRLCVHAVRADQHWVSMVALSLPGVPPPE